MPAGNVNTGIVTWSNSTKGYGFIRPDDGTENVFVHVSAAERAGLGNLAEGRKLSYGLERSRTGKMAAVDLRAV